MYLFYSLLFILVFKIYMSSLGFYGAVIIRV